MLSLKETLINRHKSINVEDFGKEQIINFIKNNYTQGTDFDKIKDGMLDVKFIKGLFVVDANLDLRFTGNGESLVEGFVWGAVHTFSVDGANITSLEGAPKSCMDLSINKCSRLTSLKGCPQAESLIEITDCPIQSLEGLPKTLGTLNISGCKNLKNLKGCPQRLTYLYANDTNLESLEGGPKTIGLDMSLNSCGKLKSFVGAPKKVGNTLFTKYCYSLTSLEGFPDKVGNKWCCQGTPIDSLEIFQIDKRVKNRIIR